MLKEILCYSMLLKIKTLISGPPRPASNFFPHSPKCHRHGNKIGHEQQVTILSRNPPSRR